MAAPVAAGVAALVMANFPELSAMEIKTRILEQARHYPELKVFQPGHGIFSVPVNFSGLSSSGGIIDAFKIINSEKASAPY